MVAFRHDHDPETLVRALLGGVHGFIGGAQLAVIEEALRRRDAHYIGVLQRISAVIATIPETYAAPQSGQLAYLHYFKGGFDFYLVEKDAGAPGDAPEDFQSQAYGMTVHGGEPERGYVSLPELFRSDVELDLYFAPKLLSEIRQQHV